MSRLVPKILPILALMLGRNCYEHVTLEADETLLVDDDGFDAYDGALSTSVKFYIYSPDNGPAEITLDNARHLVNASKPTKIIIQGPGAFRSHLWIDEMVMRYRKGDFNVIAVDWSAVSTSTAYYALSAVDAVGDVVATLIVELSTVDRRFLDGVHVIGSRLGAQVGGAAGGRVASTGPGKIDRITGLDPGAEVRLLDRDDARFVDVIHTTYEEDAIGTVDFFVVAADVAREDRRYEIRDGAEPTAEEIFALSITDEDRFRAVPCRNRSAFLENRCDDEATVPVGEWVPRNVSGVYFLSTGGAFSSVIRKNYHLVLASLMVAAFFRRLLY